MSDLTFDQFVEILQGGAALYYRLPRPSHGEYVLCWMCQNEAGFCWDHCHRHGYVRGWLCTRCNNKLAYIESPRGWPSSWILEEEIPLIQKWIPRCTLCTDVDLGEIRQKAMRRASAQELLEQRRAREELIEHYRRLLDAERQAITSRSGVTHD